MSVNFEKKLHAMQKVHKDLIEKKNHKRDTENGIYSRYKYPVLTAEHTPLTWKYDFNPQTNPHLMASTLFLIPALLSFMISMFWWRG
jgi:4-O-beta-D-mannosyl-D-glucose phosphorylase